MAEKMESIVNMLKSKVGSASALRTIFDKDRVQAAQEVIEHTKNDYFDTIQEITDIFQAAAGGDIDPQSLYHATKSLKAQAEGLGFVFLMEVSNSLYTFLQDRAKATSPEDMTFNKNDKMIIQKHAESIVSTIVKRERGKGGMVEAGILTSLELLKQKYSKHE